MQTDTDSVALSGTGLTLLTARIVWGLLALRERQKKIVTVLGNVEDRLL